MKFCPHCGMELSAQTAFCPNCGKSLGGGGSSNLLQSTQSAQSAIARNALNLPSGFWKVFAGAVGVLIFSLCDWFKFLDWGKDPISLKLFNLRGTMREYGLSNRLINELLSEDEIFRSLNALLTICIIGLIISFAILIISLVKYRTENGATSAYWGFGLSSLVSVIFIISSLVIFKDDMDEFALTIFPFLALASSVLSMIFFVERPSVSSNVSDAYIAYLRKLNRSSQAADTHKQSNPIKPLDTTPVTSRGWECESCGFSNPSSALYCKGCGNHK